jgi:hypothetical protein
MTTLVRRAGLDVVPRVLATRVLTSCAAVCVATVALASLAARPARADSMDPTPERFALQPPGLPKGLTCQSIAANPAAALKVLPKGTNLTNIACSPNNLAFQNMISELGFAIAPTAFHPARTTGFGGFNFSIEASYTKINQDAQTPTNAGPGGGVQYWHLGTQGSVDPNSGATSTQNTSPDSVIQVYSLKATKGLPFGFEITGDVSYIANSVMWTAGSDIRWALLEGFRTGWVSYLPDVSVGGGVRSLTGTSKFSLTTVGIDAQISKPITLADTSVISPYIGYQRLYIFGDSTTVDLTPNTNPLVACGYTGQNAMGEPNCANKVPQPGGGTQSNASDFNNNTVFNKVRTDRHRGIIGFSYRYEVLYLASQFLFDLTPPSDENPGLTATRQWTLSFAGGVAF